MSRYIDADKILYKDLSEGRGGCWVTFMDWIKEIPTADVRENVRAEWIMQEAQHKVDKTVLDCRVCSECGAAYVIHNNIKDLDTDTPNFCPNCGADMRGDS